MIYFDNNATTKVSTEVLKEIIPFLEEKFGNPSSTHFLGKEAKMHLELSRNKVAAFLNCNPENIFFTSGGTESNHLAIIGFISSLSSTSHFITSNIEHLSVLNVFRYLERLGHHVTYLPVNKEGIITPEHLKKAITPNTVLISLMTANNETGVLFPINELVEIAHENKILFHSDAVQAIGKIPFNLNELPMDLLSISGHKMHAPKGIGVLFVRDIAIINPIMLGGGQEKTKRSGTENLPGIIGMGKACEIAMQSMQEYNSRILELRNKLEKGVLKLVPGATINGNKDLRICNTSNIYLPGLYSAIVMQKLSEFGICVSNGSACSCAKNKGSYVLKAMGLSDSVANESIRISLSKYNTIEEIDRLMEGLNYVLKTYEPSKIVEQEYVLNNNNETCARETIKNYQINEQLLVSDYNCEVCSSKIKPFFDITTIPGLAELWSETLGSAEICIALLDGPVDTSHSCFQGTKLSQIHGFYPESTGFKQALEHGTNIASILFGSHQSLVKGIVPGCKGIVIPIYREDSKGKVIPCSQHDLARAINLAIQQGAHIINISGGFLSASGEPETILADAIRKCEKNGILIVAAAGNDGCNCIHVPAAHKSVLAVGAMNADNKPLGFSNWGAAYSNNGIMVNGENIPVAIAGGSYAAKSGTSFATAIMSGIAALMLCIQAKKGAAPNPIAIYKALLKNTIPCNSLQESQCQRILAGRLNIPAALQFINTENKIQLQAIGQEAIKTSSVEYLTYKTINKEENKMEIKNQEISELILSNQESASNNLNESTELQLDKVLPSDDNTKIMPLNHEKNSVLSPLDVYPSACPVNGNTMPQLVYVLGELSYDFVSTTRKEAFAQLMDNPYDPMQMLNYLDKNPYDAQEIVWTICIDGTPMYAIRPGGSFANSVYERLREFLKSQVANNIERVSIPGTITGNVTISTGQALQIVYPELRGMFSWSTKALVDKLLEHNDKKDKNVIAIKSEQITNFLERVYYELRNSGQLSQERAMNFAATNAFQIEHIFESSIQEELELNSINVESSPIKRPGSDCWDVKLIFFHPKKRMESSRKVYRFTVDVSDIVPILVGKLRSWSIY